MMILLRTSAIGAAGGGLTQYLLRRLGWSRQEAMLAASPGALLVMAALATRLENPLRVILSQTVRVIGLVSTVGIPPGSSFTMYCVFCCSAPAPAG